MDLARMLSTPGHGVTTVAVKPVTDGLAFVMRELRSILKRCWTNRYLSAERSAFFGHPFITKLRSHDEEQCRPSLSFGWHVIQAQLMVSSSANRIKLCQDEP